MTRRGKRPAPEPYDPGATKCSHQGCDRFLKNHAWSRIRAEGWFQQKDGTLWCPDHWPAWVEKWRSEKKNQREDRRGPR